MKIQIYFKEVSEMLLFRPSFEKSPESLAEVSLTNSSVILSAFSDGFFEATATIGKFSVLDSRTNLKKNTSKTSSQFPEVLSIGEISKFQISRTPEGSILFIYLFIHLDERTNK